jgi:hypothetical protein
MRSSPSLRVCLPPPSNQLLNQLVDFYEIQYGGHATESGLDDKILMS